MPAIIKKEETRNQSDKLTLWAMADPKSQKLRAWSGETWHLALSRQSWNLRPLHKAMTFVTGWTRKNKQKSPISKRKRQGNLSALIEPPEATRCNFLWIFINTGLLSCTLEVLNINSQLQNTNYTREHATMSKSQQKQQLD